MTITDFTNSKDTSFNYRKNFKGFHPMAFQKRFAQLFLAVTIIFCESVSASKKQSFREKHFVNIFCGNYSLTTYVIPTYMTSSGPFRRFMNTKSHI